MIVEAELYAGFLRPLAELVGLVDGVHPVRHLGAFRQPKRGDDHLFQAELLGKDQPLVEMVPQFREAEVAALATQPGGANLLAQLRGLHLCQGSKAHLRIARRRAHLDPFKAHAGQFLQRAAEIFSDGLPHRPGLAADRQAQWIGAQITGPSHADCADRAYLEKVSPRNCTHFLHGEHHNLALRLPQASSRAIIDKCAKSPFYYWAWH